MAYTTETVEENDTTQEIVTSPLTSESMYEITTPVSTVTAQTSDGVPSWIDLKTDRMTRWMGEHLRNQIHVNDTAYRHIYTFAKKSNTIVGFKHNAMAHFIYSYHNACIIDGRVAWLDMPIGDPRNTNVYFQGQTSMLHTLLHYFDGTKVSDAAGVLKFLEALLITHDELKFASSKTVFSTSDGTTFSVNVLATDYDDVIHIVDNISPEDHVLLGTKFPVVYNPTITSNKLIDDAFDAYSDYNEDRKKLIIEGNFSNGLVGPISYKNFILNIGEGSDGKSTQNKLRNLLFGENASFCRPLNSLSGRFTLSQAASSRFIFDDDLNAATISDSVSSALKRIVTGGEEDAEFKGETKTAKVSGQAVIACTNHSARLSQAEAMSRAWDRRLVVIQWKHNFKRGLKANPTAQLSKDDAFFAERVAADPEALSYLFNLVLDGVRRLIVNQNYTEVPEDIKKAQEILGSVDTVQDFLDQRYDVYATWERPHLIRWGTGYKTYALVYPHSYTVDDARLSYSHIKSGIHRDWDYFDARDGKTYCYIPSDINVSIVGFTNERDIAYGAYEAFRAETGTNGKGTLSKDKFTKSMCKKGFHTKRSRCPLRSEVRDLLLIPDGVDTKEDIANYISEVRLKSLREDEELNKTLSENPDSDNKAGE